MMFIKTKTEFPSYVHKVIYLNALRQTPIEKSLADVEGIDSGLLISCREYYDFIMEMHSDMYEQPTEWGMNPGEYEEFLGDKKENGMKRKMPTKTKTLRSKSRNCIQPYFQLLLSLGKCGRLSDKSLYIPSDDYLGMKKYFDKSLEPKIKNMLNIIPYKVRLNALKRVGFLITEEDEGAIITSERYPNMLYAMSELAKSAENIITFGEHNFFHLEFRQILNGYTPNYDDVVQALTDEQRSVIDKVHTLAMEMKLICSCTTYWKVNYHFKGKLVMCIDTDDRFEYKSGLINTVRIRINGTNHGAVEYIDRISEQGDDFVKYFMKHLNYCTACSTSHIGWIKNVLGRNVRLCGHPSFRITSACEDDLGYIKKFIEFRKEMIVYEKTNISSLKCFTIVK